jgi:DNA-binding NarL/FixJ family response regulator
MNDFAQHSAGGRLRVVIADDSSAVRDSLSSLLSSAADIEIVGTAENGFQAVELVRSLKPDVLTLDLRLPGLDGLAVLQTLQKEQRKTSVVVMTGYDEPEYRERCLELGATRFFHKVWEMDKALTLLLDYASLHTNSRYPAARTPELNEANRLLLPASIPS